LMVGGVWWWVEFDGGALIVGKVEYKGRFRESSMLNYILQYWMVFTQFTECSKIL
jgi:hypothetical protein